MQHRGGVIRTFCHSKMPLPGLAHGPFASRGKCQTFSCVAKSVVISQGRIFHSEPSNFIEDSSAYDSLAWRPHKAPLLCRSKAKQSWERRLPIIPCRLLPLSERMIQDIWWQGTVGKHYTSRWPVVSLCPKPNSGSESQRSTSKRDGDTLECRAQAHSQPWNMDEEVLVAETPLMYLPETGRAESRKLASALGLIMGTAVGPGILGLPAGTLQAGLIPSSVTIVVSWAYVMASVLLVAELSYAVMAEQGGGEVSFTSLAVRTLGHTAGRVVAAVYALLNYALLVACVAGLHSILACWLPLPPALVCLLSPGVVVSLLAFTPFKAVDSLNRALCGLMLAAITSLVGIGIYVGQNMWAGSMGYGTWSLNAVLPAVPVIVLTLGFHVITPLVCKVVGGRPQEARKAILCGGAVPLAMVLAWNAVILGLAPARRGTSALDPIKLLLSMSSIAAPAVQAFAFAALATTLIGYALSFPKQLIDTARLFGLSPKAAEKEDAQDADRTKRMAALVMAIAPPAVVAMTSPAAFASALDFAGVYANCFLFGVLPPIMAWVYRYRQPQADEAGHARLVPGGRILLVALLFIALFLGLKPSSPRL